MGACRIDGICEIQTGIDESPVQVEDYQVHAESLTGFDPALRSLDPAYWLPAGLLLAQLILRHLALQGIAMDAKQFAGGAAIALSTLDGTGDEGLFEDLDSFLHEKAFFKQMIDELLKCLFHCE